MESKMKKLILSIMLLLLFSVLNIEAKNTAVKIDKQSSTNSLIDKKISDKEKVDKKKKVFDKNLNVALLTDEELKQLINDALLNCNNAELMELGIKLQKALKFDWTPIISSAMLARAKCDLKKSQRRCEYALSSFFSEIGKGEFSNETKKRMDEAIESVPIGCQDWMTINYLAGTTVYAMHIAIHSDNDFDKAWAIYKKTLLSIKACKSGSTREKKWAVNGTIHSEISTAIGIKTIYNKNKKVKLSSENAKEIKELIERLPVKDFDYGERNRQKILKSIQKYINQK